MSDNEFLELLQAHPELWETVLHVLLEFDAKTVA